MPFTLEVSVTEKCNLGCPYCYVANRPTWMSKEVFDKGIKDVHKLMERSGDKDYYVSFFGGEPMLNWDLIQHAVPVLQADPKNTGINIITNLTMVDEEKAAWIKENNVGISWSFDGMGSNESRPLLPILENTNPETEQLFNGILDLYNNKRDIIMGLTNGCKVMIWPGNTKEMVENFEFLLDYGIDHPDFSLVRDDVWTIDDIKQYKYELEKLTDLYIEKVRGGKFCSIGLIKLAILDTLYGLVKGKRPFGCFAGTHGGVLMSSGEFYPCARFASKKIMQMDEKFSFKYYQDQFDPRKYDKCIPCDLRQVCNAGCTYSQVMNGNKPVDSVCELFHITYTCAHRVVEELKDDPTFHSIVEMWLAQPGEHDDKGINKPGEKFC
jgi:radical SAM protein with 4Fe4S-binding SPASM domain